MRVELSDGDGYKLDQQATIEEILKQHGLTEAKGVHIPIGEDSNDIETDQMKYLVKEGALGEPSSHDFQSLVGSLLWVVRCTRPDISFAVHKAMRRTHHPTLNDLKLAKRIARYLKGTKELNCTCKRAR
uniref:DEHA2C12243p2 putative n=1 Tax=Albugo laibachii Nc14 TaxID=890382 RepID=F0WV15_9STRA|nr:DEHA2C12243p2 putative [Albugo laibachii Nc14]|eukprot:CCA25251.1 DEHA2C12243p2 putative [Albugo laibachii Nc14]